MQFLLGAVKRRVLSQFLGNGIDAVRRPREICPPDCPRKPICTLCTGAGLRGTGEAGPLALLQTQQTSLDPFEVNRRIEEKLVVRFIKT